MPYPPFLTPPQFPQPPPPKIPQQQQIQGGPDHNLKLLGDVVESREQIVKRERKRVAMKGFRDKRKEELERLRGCEDNLFEKRVGKGERNVKGK